MMLFAGTELENLFASFQLSIKTLRQQLQFVSIPSANDGSLLTMIGQIFPTSWQFSGRTAAQ
jgi:hypothetical protein